MLFTLPLPAGKLGTAMTLAAMRGMVERDHMLPVVRLTAAKIVRGLGPDFTDQAVALRHWMVDFTEFLRDPYRAEMLHGPAWQIHRILTTGIAQVDCDDIAMLAAALGKAVGLRARFTVVGFGSPTLPYRHVWTELHAPGRSSPWIQFDLTRPQSGIPPGRITHRQHTAV